MSPRVMRPQRNICQLCELIVARNPCRQLRSARRHSFRSAVSTRVFSTSRWHLQNTKPSRDTRPHFPSASPGVIGIESTEYKSTEAELSQALKEVREACKAFLALEKVPSEQDTKKVLAKCNTMAALLLDEPAPPKRDNDGAASALLDLDDSRTEKVPLRKPSRNVLQMAEDLSKLAYSIVKYPSVYIAPEVLKLYVSIQAHLRKPETLPEIFYLYANKPLPVEGSSPITYTNQNPNNISNCIPSVTAEGALQAAIDAKKLVVAMDIIESSYTTTAYRRDKFLRKALIPTAGLALAPVAAYTLASQLANFQTTMEPGMATNVAFAGIVAYVGFTATLGVIAVTTSNDQMVRVTWAPGVPLRQRWMREEERAALDKVACAWGFKEIWRRGEEEGEDWEALREWINRKAMMLDRVELMEGME